MPSPRYILFPNHLLQDPKIMALVSQSDIAAYLSKHISVLGPRYAHEDVRVLPSWANNSLHWSTKPYRGQLPVRDHFRAFTKVVSVPPHSKALDAFALMWSKGLGGVAVIDSQVHVCPSQHVQPVVRCTHTA